MIEFGAGIAAGVFFMRFKNSVVSWVTRASKKVEKAIDESAH